MPQFQCPSPFSHTHTGKLEEAIGHYINLVHFSGNPQQTLLMLRQVVPAPLYRVICQAYAMAEKELNPAAAAAAAQVKPDDVEVE